MPQLPQILPEPWENNRLKNLSYLLALHSVDGLGPIRLRRLLDFFEDPLLAWQASDSELKSLGIHQNVLENLKQKRRELNPQQFLEQVISKGLKILTIYDDNYPESLKQIYDPPVVLYYKGQILASDKKAIGVVGTRKVTGYGALVTKKLTEGLVNSGFTIVSGLARGVDTIAHQTALNSGGRTLAILAGGINSIFPPQNTDLASKIIDGNGAYLAEFPPDYPHLAGNFPSRNRIIAGLSKAVLVTEAAIDSGSLITARCALDQGKDVFAVPGPITSELSLGPFSLIKEGASLVSTAEDILEALGVDLRSTPLKKVEELNLSKTENEILTSLKNETKHIDEIVRDLKISASEISGALIKMEILGVIKNLGGGNYSVSL